MRFSSREFIVRIGPKGTITIPKPLRDAVGLKENSYARIRSEQNRIIIEPIRVLTNRPTGSR